MDVVPARGRRGARGGDARPGPPRDHRRDALHQLPHGQPRARSLRVSALMRGLSGIVFAWSLLGGDARAGKPKAQPAPSVAAVDVSAVLSTFEVLTDGHGHYLAEVPF